MTKRRALKGSGTTITEELTKINFNRLRQLKDLDAVERAWTKQGEAYAVGRNGKILKYNTMQSLSEFNRIMKAGMEHRSLNAFSKDLLIEGYFYKPNSTSKVLSGLGSQ
ncbi:hypothetical protein ElyMa_002634100 [Elysia marginata]|uniref:Uncharacterized protein n=1 Tax=Elysia marginata TaxID=1093978 RepID=A0AAV4H7N9_9GAST|nr:hypothetical protein ElyMa_002634100 [Elysia marginata]